MNYVDPVAQDRALGRNSVDGDRTRIGTRCFSTTVVVIEARWCVRPSLLNEVFPIGLRRASLSSECPNLIRRTESTPSLGIHAESWNPRRVLDTAPMY